MIFTYDKAIFSLCGTNVEFSISNNNYDEFVWGEANTIPKPTKESLDAEIARLQAEYEAKSYARSRAAEYPSLQEQLDMQYWDAINGTTTWADAIAAVKTKYPKPE